MSECLRCGLCCISCDIKLDELTGKNDPAVLDRLKWLNLHRCDTQIHTQKDGKKHSVLRIPLICRMLDQDKEGKYFCKDYNNRPQVCRNFACARARAGIPGNTPT